MKPLVSRAFYRPGLINHKIEFLFILGWILLFPAKESHLYFSGTALLICLVAFRNIYFMKTIGLSYFSYFLPLFNFILALSLFFAAYILKSIHLFSDIFLVSAYFILFYYDKRKEKNYFHSIAFIISVFSFINVIRYVVPLPGSIGGPKSIFFVSSIHEGIVSGIGVLILICYLLHKWNPWFFSLLVLNLAGVFVSESKAAYIGVVLFSFLLLLLKKKKLIPFLFIFVILTAVVPNPIRSMFDHWLTKDPYALNRVDIWKMSLNILKDHPLTGVGLDNFSEVSGRYNFKQTRGPANYFKVPQRPHNDYLKIIAELGLPGLAILLALFYFLVKKIFLSFASLFDISKILILYLLFQAFFFNILFNVFFFFILIFLLKIVSEQEKEVTFKSFSPSLKLFLSSLLVVIFVIGYLFTWLSAGLIEKSKRADNVVQAFPLLDKAGYLNPLDQNVYYLKALLLTNYFKQTANSESFYSAVDNLKKAQRLNRYFIQAYLLESELYLELLKRRIKYQSLDEEITAPLEEAEIYAPFNPFIKLKKARVYFEFDKNHRAKEEAVKAITLEPEFVAALYFLHKHFNYFQDEKTFNKKIDNILKKAGKLKPPQGHYLFKLYEIPGAPWQGGPICGGSVGTSSNHLSPLRP